MKISSMDLRGGPGLVKLSLPYDAFILKVESVRKVPTLFYSHTAEAEPRHKEFKLLIQHTGQASDWEMEELSYIGSVETFDGEMWHVFETHMGEHAGESI